MVSADNRRRHKNSSFTIRVAIHTVFRTLPCLECEPLVRRFDTSSFSSSPAGWKVNSCLWEHCLLLRPQLERGCQGALRAWSYPPDSTIRLRYAGGLGLAKLDCMCRGVPISASHQRPFPTTLARKRRLKRIGIQSSLAVMLAGFGGAVLSGSLPGMLAPALVPLTVLMGASPALYLGTLLIKNEGRLHCVWDGSKLHFEEGVPPCWVSSARLPPLPNDTVTVSPTGTFTFDTVETLVYGDTFT